MEQQASKTREEALRELREISYWLGERKEGEWVPESSATNNKRTVRRIGRNADGAVVDMEYEELIHMHGGYRPKFKGEKKTRRAFFFRGARVWRD